MRQILPNISISVPDVSLFQDFIECPDISYLSEVDEGLRRWAQHDFREPSILRYGYREVFSAWSGYDNCMAQIWHDPRYKGPNRHIGPAVVITDLDGQQVVHAQFRRLGWLHRADGPAVLHRNQEGVHMFWLENHRQTRTKLVVGLDSDAEILNETIESEIRSSFQADVTGVDAPTIRPNYVKLLDTVEHTRNGGVPGLPSP